MRSNRSWALSTTSRWQCGPPPNPASFRPVEFSPCPGWFGSAEAADANPKDVNTTATTTSARFIAYPSLSTDLPEYYLPQAPADSSPPTIRTRARNDAMLATRTRADRRGIRLRLPESTNAASTSPPRGRPRRPGRLPGGGLRGRRHIHRRAESTRSTRRSGLRPARHRVGPALPADHLPRRPDPVHVFFTTCPTPFRDAHELIGSVTQDRGFGVPTVAVDSGRRPLTDSGMGGADDRFRAVHDLHDQSTFTDHDGGW